MLSATSNFIRGTIAVAPFPFSDIPRAKPRPVVIVATSEAIGAHPPQYVCAMITSTAATWISDVIIQDLASTGLTVPCHIRMKLFTLDARLLIRSIGALSSQDRMALEHRLRQTFQL